MIVLSLETAAGVVGAAIGDGRRVLAESNTPDRRHTELLPGVIEEVLASTGLCLADVDAIGVDVGPGLFTGLRVGVATAQGLAFALSIPVVPVTSTEVLCAVARGAGWEGEVLAVVDARRGEVFVARYDANGRCTLAPSRMAPEGLGTMRDRLLAIGDGARRYGEHLASSVESSTLDLEAGALCEVAVSRLMRGRALREPGVLRPLYLRAPDAVSNWTTRT